MIRYSLIVGVKLIGFVDGLNGCVRKRRLFEDFVMSNWVVGGVIRKMRKYYWVSKGRGIKNFVVIYKFLLKERY